MARDCLAEALKIATFCDCAVYFLQLVVYPFCQVSRFFGRDHLLHQVFGTYVCHQNHVIQSRDGLILLFFAAFGPFAPLDLNPACVTEVWSLACSFW